MHNVLSHALSVKSMKLPHGRAHGGTWKHDVHQIVHAFTRVCYTKHNICLVMLVSSRVCYYKHDICRGMNAITFAFSPNMHHCFPHYAWLEGQRDGK